MFEFHGCEETYHLVHKDECGRVGRVCEQGPQALLKVGEIVLPFGRTSIDVEHVDENTNVGKDGRLLAVEIALQKATLPATVPEIEHQGSEKTLVRLLDVDSCTQTMSEGR